MLFFNLSNLVLVFYIYVCTWLRIVINLLRFIIAHHKTLGKFLQICIFLPFIGSAILISGDIEKNPGPGNVSGHNISICHWNLNGITANNFVKISLLDAYNAVHDFDLVCISETFLNSDYSSDDPRLSIQGYTMIRSDHPSNSKSVCIYYKEHLSFVRRNDITLLDECIVGEIRIGNSKCFVTCAYCSPSQTADETNIFISGLEPTCSSIYLESPLCSFVIGDLNAKCSNWWKDGINNPFGLELHNMTTLLGYSQLINEATNFEPNKSHSCIDMIFESQPNLVLESGISPSLYNKCHHQMVYAKVSLKVFSPPSYKREIWHYNRAQVNLIKGSIQHFDWEDQVELFDNTLLNIFRNFIPDKTKKCSHKDPPWMNKEIKSALRRKNRLYKKYISGGKKQEDEVNLRQNTDFVSNLIATTKDYYFSNLGKRLNDPTTDPKTYWSILKHFLNKIKIPAIPPLLVNGIFETDFGKKAAIFNFAFAKQCNILNNGSFIPELDYKTNKRIANITFSSSG